MIKQAKNQMLLVAALSALGFSAPAAFAQSTKDVTVDARGEVPYNIDQRNVVTRSGFGLCWRTGYWTPAAAATAKAGQFPVGCECDKDLLPKEACTAKVAAAPAPAPAPQPAPIAAPKPTAEKVKIAADALFDFDKAVLRPEGKTKLDEIAAKAGDVNLEVILAVGHTDRIGSEGYNQKLSEKRAAAVKSYLVGKGIEANRIYTEGKGAKQPVSGDACAKLGKATHKNKKLVECLQPDRRVEIELIGTTK
ncbi:MAG: OmpA family protein [Zoogloea sp.]|nr:OmpA family protein [Zoogloea sp.]